MESLKPGATSPHLWRVLLALCLLPLCSCEPVRPEAAQAKSLFRATVPAAEITEVRIVGDEVVARTFEISYRPTGSTDTRRALVLYLLERKAWRGTVDLRE
jgi:hypothetical protein